LTFGVPVAGGLVVGGEKLVGKTATVIKKVGPEIKKIAGYTSHGARQAIGRDGGRGVDLEAIFDVVKNPQQIINQADGAVKYIGKEATVVLNKIGEIITTWGKPRNP
jgi:hypothetical protein